MVEINWPLHIQAKLRLRKTANGEGGADVEEIELVAIHLPFKPLGDLDPGYRASNLIPWVWSVVIGLG